MPIYSFVCGKGHQFEKVVPYGATASGCLCGGIGQRDTKPQAFAHTSGLPTDFKPPPDFYRLNSEAIAAKKEARAEIQDAIQNGWAPKDNHG